MLRFGLVIAAIITVLDQATKIWMLEAVLNPPRLIEIAPFFNLVVVWNKGVSFGMFSQAPWGSWPLLALSAAIVAGLVAWLARLKDRFPACAVGLVIGGAVGNAIDRAIFGAVFDFLDFHWAAHHWPAFNLADSAITVGAAMIVADALFRRPR
ncbi:MAG: signal peptidase II [Alphaproteobacteria bacterium]